MSTSSGSGSAAYTYARAHTYTHAHIHTYTYTHTHTVQSIDDDYSLDLNVGQSYKKVPRLGGGGHRATHHTNEKGVGGKVVKRLGLKSCQARTALEARVPFEEAVALAKRQACAVGTGNETLQKAWLDYLEVCNVGTFCLSTGLRSTFVNRLSSPFSSSLKIARRRIRTEPRFVKARCVYAHLRSGHPPSRVGALRAGAGRSVPRA